LGVNASSEGLTKPPTPASRVLPPEGEDLSAKDLPPLGEVARSDEGGLVSFSLPPCSPRRRGPRPFHSGGKRPTDLRFLRVTAEEAADEHPPLPTLSPSMGERACLFFTRSQLRGKHPKRKTAPEFPPGPFAKHVPASRGTRAILFDGDGGAGFFELLLDLFGFLLGDVFLDGLRSAFHQVLGFFQTEV
jgi:hypothetical protein